MRKPTIFIGENKDADQFRSNLEADPLHALYIRKFKLLAVFFSCTDRFVWDLFGNHIVGFLMRRLIFFKMK